MRAALVVVAALLAALCPVTAAAAPSDCTAAGTKIMAEPWPQKMLAPDRAWPFATGTGITVAVLDSGVDPTVPKLKGHVESSKNYLTDGSSPDTDCVGHGTEVAGIIAAQSDQVVGFFGVAPGVKILPVEVSEREVMANGKPGGDTATPEQLAEAITYAVDHHADIINMSLVMYDEDPQVKAAIADAERRNVLVVAAVGNDAENGNPTPYPAAYPGVLGVGAIDSTGTRASDSQHGKYVDVVAPGVQVITTAREHGEVRVNGTSFATPFVSGVAALVRERYPTLSAAQVADRIMATADPASGPASEYGHGIVDPYRAVTEPMATGSPRALPAMHDAASDRAAAARAASDRAATGLAVRVTAGVLVVAAVVAFLAFAVPRGRRRGWVPRLEVARPPPPPADPAPADSLFALPKVGEPDEETAPRAGQ